MNTYSTSTGERFTQSQIDARIRIAKAKALEMQFDEYGFHFCQNCKRNSSGTRLDMSHNISVKECKETGRTELAFDFRNLTILCRLCHSSKDLLTLKWSQ